MKVYLKVNNTGVNLYTENVLRHFAQLNKIELINNEDEADYIFVSICDPDDLPTLKGLRQRNPNTPIVMGGFESYCGEPYLAWANYIVVGEGWDFFEAFGKDYKKALSLPCVLTRTKEAWANYNVNYPRMPLVKIPGKERFYYLGGRGCHRKCKFCLTSRVQPNSENEMNYLKKAVNVVEKSKGKINIIGNDSRTIIHSPATNAQSVTVKDYLKTPTKFKSSMLHFGIEGWTEEDRKEFGKPITKAEINLLIDVLKQHKQQAEFFFIANYPGWSNEKVDEFINNLEADPTNSPGIYVKITHFDPAPHTPYSKVALIDNWANTKQIFSKLVSKNRRFRVFPTRSNGREAWRVVFKRCSPDQALILGPQPNTPNSENSFKLFYDDLKKKGLEFLAQEIDFEPCNRIHVTYKNEWKGRQFLKT